MLDDLKLIHQRDAQDALGVAQKQWQQLQQRYPTQQFENLEEQPINNVVLGGMGGSALAASFITSWPTTKKPYEVVRNYNVPNYVGKDTLFIASSYSGNTEETLSALAEAQERGARIAVIAAGGKLAEIAEQGSLPFYQIPSGLQPRMAVFYNFAALIQLLVDAGLIDGSLIDELHKTSEWLGGHVNDLLPEVPTANNPAKKLAIELVGNSPVIYASQTFYPVAYKWKINFNENAKTVAWCSTLPEFNHNEFLGWTSHPTDKPYKIIDIRSSLDNPRILKRFEISQKLLSGKRPHPEVIDPQGDSLLKQLLWATQMGDFVSLYLAMLNGLNPTPVDLIVKLKQELSE